MSREEEISAPQNAPTAPNRPMARPRRRSTLPSRKWLYEPESVVKAMAARDVPRAVWMGTSKPTVSRVIMTPAPPAPTKPITAPSRSMAVKTNMAFSVQKKRRPAALGCNSAKRSRRQEPGRSVCGGGGFVHEGKAEPRGCF